MGKKSNKPVLSRSHKYVPMARSVGAAAPTAARLDEIYAYCKDEVLGWSFICTEKESARLAA